MPTENNTNGSGSTEETSGQEQQQDQGQQQQTTDETSGNGSQQQVTIDDNTRLPDTHPLLKAYRAQLEQNRKNETSQSELNEARSQAAKATKLQEELDARPTQEAVDTLQKRYDRLEEFLVTAGGPLGRALDSRTFTRELFEGTRDVKDIVKDWQKANPSATAAALGSGNGHTDSGDKPDMNKLIRAARSK